METTSDHKSIPQKSPNYPNMNLSEAISKAKILYEKDGKVGAPKKVALEHLGYKVPSGASARTLSALKKFDLIADNNGRIVLTQRALDLLIYPKDSDRNKVAIKHCAISPRIYSALWREYSNGFPSDSTLKAELIDKYNFNRNQVEGFLKDFRKTIEFAGLTVKDAEALTGEDNGDQKLKVGDYVQWESPGGIQFEAKQLTGFSNDGTFAFVEGSNTGLPVEELSMVAPPTKDNEKSKQGAIFTNVRPNPMNTETFILDEGQATLQLPAKLSQESYEDLKSWLELIMKKTKRAADKKDASQGQVT